MPVYDVNVKIVLQKRRPLPTLYINVYLKVKMQLSPKLPDLQGSYKMAVNSLGVDGKPQCGVHGKPNL